ncbi:restriction endonuclease subunit S [Achromobacter kerstersii]
MQRYESYKPSGIPWVGDIPSHWGIKKNKFLLSERKATVGKDAPKFKLLSLTLQGVILRDMENPKGKFPAEFDSYKQVSPEDLIFCLFDVEETPRTVGLAKHHGMITGAYTVTRCNPQVSSAFLYYYYLSLDDGKQLRSLYTGLRNVITRDAFFSLAAPLPPCDEQERIVAFLDQIIEKIDAAIAKKRWLIELLQEQKNIRIHQAVLRGLNPEVPMRDSCYTWIGAVPSHWKVIPNRYIFREQNARSLRGEETHLSMSQRYGLVPAKELDVQTLQSESYEGAKLCQKGDLVQNRLKAHLAVFAVAPCDGLVSPDYSVFRLQNSENQSVYFERLFKTPNYLGEFNRRVRGIVVGFLRLYSDDFNSIPAIVPPCDEQAEIVSFIEKANKEFEDIRAKIDAEIAKLRELKAIIVASAVTGKIKI